jgi:hypothetical protein
MARKLFNIRMRQGQIYVTSYISEQNQNGNGFLSEKLKVSYEIK